MFHRSGLRALLAAGVIAIVATVGCSSSPESRVKPAVAAVPQWRLPHQVAPDHYAITVAPDLARSTFSGEEVIELRVLEPTALIVLNSAEIAIRSATVEAAGKSQTVTVAFDEKTQMATFSLPQPLSPGQARMSISYSGILNDQLRGFYLSKANNRRYAVTQLEATDARRMFPGFDEPAMKATFNLTAVIDTADSAISNGAIVSDTPGPAPGKHSVKFSTTPKMSTYLLALVVGDFECISGGMDGIPIRVCATPDKKGLTSVALASAQQVMQFYNRYFGIKYPFNKLDIVAVPDFAAGAMENTAAIFYRETDLLVDENSMSIDANRNVVEILAHEMAHQWFGDLVTMAWWDDIWLNEGFATWMETKPLKAIHPEWHSDVAEVQSNLQASQERYHLPEQSSAPSIWQIPLCVRGAGGAGSTSCFLLGSASQTTAVPGCSLPLVGNANATGYYRVAYEPASLEAIGRHISGVSEAERVSIASDTWALVRSGRYDIGATLEIARALSSDHTPGVVDTVASSLGFIGRRIATGPTVPEYQHWVARTFRPALETATWSRAKGEPDDRGELRATLVSLVAGIGHDEASRTTARSLVTAYLKNPATLDGTLADTLVRLAAEGGDAALYDQFAAKWKSSNAPEDRDRFLLALGSFTDPALVKRTIDLALSKDVRVQDTANLLATVLFGAAGYQVAWPVVRERWNDVAAHIDPSFGPGTVVSAIGSFCDAKATDDVEQFFKSHQLKGTTRTVVQSVQQIRSCAALKKMQSRKLAEWLAKAK